MIKNTVRILILILITVLTSCTENKPVEITEPIQQNQAVMGDTSHTTKTDSVR